MSPRQLFHEQQQQQHAKREIFNGNGNYGMCPSPLKINQDSHSIKKSTSPPRSTSFLPSPSSSTSTSSLAAAAASTKPQLHHRQPVIIYTHSPKVIHTHPRDFKALVQKLTGLSRSDDNHHDQPPRPKQETGTCEDLEVIDKSHKDDVEDSSVITEENCSRSSGGVGDFQINSCFSTNVFDPPPPPPPINPNCFENNIPWFTPNSGDHFFCSAQPFYNNYGADSMFLMPNMRSTISSSSTLEGMNEFREF